MPGVIVLAKRYFCCRLERGVGLDFGGLPLFFFFLSFVFPCFLNIVDRETWSLHYLQLLRYMMRVRLTQRQCKSSQVMDLCDGSLYRALDLVLLLSI
jgi:hypothetical protein